VPNLILSTVDTDRSPSMSEISFRVHCYARGRVGTGREGTGQ